MREDPDIFVLSFGGFYCPYPPQLPTTSTPGDYSKVEDGIIVHVKRKNAQRGLPCTAPGHYRSHYQGHGQSGLYSFANTPSLITQFKEKERP